jgi:hypothetical protein
MHCGARPQVIKGVGINNFQLKAPSKKPSDTSPQQVTKTRAAKRLMQSLGRVMALYFTRQPVFVFPPHRPLLMPVLCTSGRNNSELLVKFFYFIFVTSWFD